MTKNEYEVLAAFRYQMRRFLRFSENASRQAGLTPQQHQLLLAIKGFPGRDWATVGELGSRLQVKQHSVVGLVNRAEQLHLVFRRSSPDDGRVVEVHLTPKGEATLEKISQQNRHELRQMAGEFRDLVQMVENESP